MMKESQINPLSQAETQNVTLPTCAISYHLQIIGLVHMHANPCK